MQIEMLPGNIASAAACATRRHAHASRQALPGRRDSPAVAENLVAITAPTSVTIANPKIAKA
jgi:hypothetical protein